MTMRLSYAKILRNRRIFAGYSCACRGEAMTTVGIERLKTQSEFPAVPFPYQTPFLLLAVIDGVGTCEHDIAPCFEFAAECDSRLVAYHLDVRLLRQAI